MLSVRLLSQGGARSLSLITGRQICVNRNLSTIKSTSQTACNTTLSYIVDVQRQIGPPFGKPLFAITSPKSLPDESKDFHQVKNDGKASLEQLLKVENNLLDHVENIFNKPDYRLYTSDLQFIDNIRGIQTQNINSYILQLYKVRLSLNFKYSKFQVRVLNKASEPHDSFVRVRWRIVARPGLLGAFVKAFTLTNKEIWIDGVSTFMVNSNGLIYRHICDNISSQYEDIGEKDMKNTLISRGIAA